MPYDGATEHLTIQFNKVYARHRMFSIIDRTQLNVSRTGIDQAMSGQIVTNPADRQGLAKLLHLVAEPAVSQLIYPAVQKIRGG